MTNHPHKLSDDEAKYLRAVVHCTDEDGLPIMSSEADTVMALERAGLLRIAGQYQNRTFPEPAAYAALSRHAAA